MTKKYDWIDCLKGFGAVLVIFGHLNPFFPIERYIYSFHMPLFFIVSCATTKWSVSNEDYLRKLKKTAIHLLIPVLATYVFILIVQIIRDHSLILDLHWYKDRRFTLFFASGYRVPFAGMEGAALGKPWFLVALFIGRSVFDYLHMKLSKIHLLLASLLIGISGMLLGNLQFLPFSFDVALAVMPFLYFGYRLQEMKITVHPVRKLFIWLGIWLVSFYFTSPNIFLRTYLEIAVRRYSLIPVSLLCAIAGSMFLLEFSVICCKLKTIAKPLIWLGKNSLYLYMIHIIDPVWEDFYYIEGHQFLSALLAILCDLVAFGILMLIKAGITKLVKSKKAA